MARTGADGPTAARLRAPPAPPDDTTRHELGRDAPVGKRGAAYRRDILQPMYVALDRHPHSEAIRHGFLNSRGAVLRFARRALEIRVLDTQECVRMGIAIAVLVRAALRQLARAVLDGRHVPPPHASLVADFNARVRGGSAALVAAPHLTGDEDYLPVDQLNPIRASE
jgi:hypothetical protein